MAKSFGVPGESARHQAEARRRRREQLERQEDNWNGGSLGEEGTAEVIEKRCPNAVMLHDRRMPDSRANIDHIVLVPSGVWVIDSKRMKGRIKVEDGKDGTKRLLVNGRNQTELVHKLTWQLNAVRAAMAQIHSHVPVHGAFCFWLAIEKTRDLFNPRVEDNRLPLLRTLTINGYPLFHPRQMTRKLNSAGTLSLRRAEELAATLAECFPGASSTPARLSKDDFRAGKQAEHQQAWEQQRDLVEAGLGCPTPELLSQRLSNDAAVWCHHTLWHSRVYLACIHGKVGSSFTYRDAASVVAAHHDGRPGRLQWRALTGFLEHLRVHGYISFEPAADGRLEEVAVTADLQHPPAQ